jgi:hypothetical protein
MKEITKRQQYEILRSQLEMERSSFLSHWRDLGDYILPRRPRFTVTDTNKGDRRNHKIVDSTATFSARTLRSGMMAGVTSPARPWFRLTTPDPGMAEFGPVKDWLQLMSTRMSTIFLRSNLYNVLPIIYGDIGVFGTGAVSLEEDYDTVIRCYPFPIGSYMISVNERLKVDTFFREFRMTVRQLVTRFGKKDGTGKPDWSNFSSMVRQMWDQGQMESWIDVCHLVKPNEEWDPKKVASKYKRYVSVYYEKGYTGSTQNNYITPGDDNKYLSEKGYDYFPILVPRWEVTGEDSYGTECPGMTCLGDVKALQTLHKRKAQAIEKMVNPPLVGPSALRSVKTSMLPGDITYTDEREGTKGLRPLHEVQPRIQELLLDVQDHQGRIQKAFFEDLFLMLANSDRRQITAREIEERHEEKLLAVGPVLEQLNQDLLDPAIDNTFDIMVRQGMVPPPPSELEGMPLKVEYISIMAQAQKLVGVAGIERFAGFVSQIAANDPQVMDKVDSDQMIDEYGDAVGVSPNIVRSDEEVENIRAQRAQAQRAQQQAEAVQAGASAVKDLSQADMSGQNALTALVQQAQAGQITPAV